MITPAKKVDEVTEERVIPLREPRRGGSLDKAKPGQGRDLKEEWTPGAKLGPKTESWL